MCFEQIRAAGRQTSGFFCRQNIARETKTAVPLLLVFPILVIMVVGSLDTEFWRSLQYMNVTADALRKIHRIHRQLTDLRDRLARGPKQVRAADANVTRLEESHQQAQDTLKQARLMCDQKQLQLKSSEDRIADMKRKRNECSTNKEYQALIEQIAADEMATSVLSDEILEIMEKMDEHQKLVEQTDTQVTKAAEELKRLKDRVEGQREQLELDVARSTGELADAEKELPDDFRVEYDRMVKARGDEALTAVDGEMCGGCYQMITPQMLNDLKLARPVFCKSCGRLLYLSEDHDG